MHVSPSKKEIAQEYESSSVLCAERQTPSLAGHENPRRMEALQAMLSWFVQGVVTKGLMERELFGGDLLPMVFTVTVVDNFWDRVSAISPMCSSIWNWAGWGTILQRYARSANSWLQLNTIWDFPHTR